MSNLHPANMSCPTLLVHLESGQPNASLLAVAGQFAERFHAHVVGIASCQPMMMVGGDGVMGSDVFAEDLRRMTAAIDLARIEFHDALESRCASLEWRSEITLAPTSSYLSTQGRSADVIMTGSVPADPFDLSRAANAGSLVIESGRPVLIVPSHARPMRFDHALVAWKDTRECRRATADAMPLLKEMQRVTILEVVGSDDRDAAHVRVQDVASWLGRHGVTAVGLVERSIGDDAAQIRFAADERKADVIVAGAYGHSRLHEWVIGGVTRDLLLDGRRAVLVSH